MRGLKQWIAVAVLGLALPGSVMAAPTIDTTSSWNGTSSVSAFGETNTATYGQTFTVTGHETVFDSFSFWADDHLNTDAVDFAAYVMAWDGLKATGSVLYQSSMQTTTNNGGAGGMEQLTFNTGGLALAAGQSYVAFLSASQFFDGTQGTAAVGDTNADVYAGGGFVFRNNGSNFGLLTTTTWETFHGGGVEDLAFVANFSQPVVSAVPEPSTLALAGLGATGLIAGRRRRRKAKAA